LQTVAAIEQTGARNLAALQRKILKDNTIMSGEWIGGHIVLSPPPKDQDNNTQYGLEVALGGEIHEFQIHQSRQ
jgi:hypothetical protein